MAISQRRPKRKLTGGVYKKQRDKRRRELGRAPAHIKIKQKVVRRIRGVGGNKKLRLLSDNVVNLCDPQTKKLQKSEIVKILENPANPHFARMGLLTKGAIIETKAGKARITNKPGQEGIINAVLIK